MEKTDKIKWAICIDCDWEGDVKDCPEDAEWDEFKGQDYYYPLCPVCGGGIEISQIYE